MPRQLIKVRGNRMDFQMSNRNLQTLMLLMLRIRSEIDRIRLFRSGWRSGYFGRIQLLRWGRICVQFFKIWSTPDLIFKIYKNDVEYNLKDFHSFFNRYRSKTLVITRVSDPDRVFWLDSDLKIWSDLVWTSRYKIPLKFNFSWLIGFEKYGSDQTWKIDRVPSNVNG